MYRYIIGFACALTTLSAAATPPPGEAPIQDFQYDTSKPSAYPAFSIVGQWEYRAPQSTCVDRYEFQTDGTMRATSGKQVVDSRYTISATHTPYAFYELKHQIVSVNNEKDCDGERSEAGYQGVHYVRYNTTGDSMVMCEDETAMLENCFGPLNKVK